jgi:hypothetical protein
MTLYRYIPVWRREPEGAKLYRCFEIVGVGGYVVQSADYFTSRTWGDREAQMEGQFMELFLEQRPEERIAPRSSIEDAIEHFESSFS